MCSNGRRNKHDDESLKPNYGLRYSKNLHFFSPSPLKTLRNSYRELFFTRYTRER